jgi:N utilization substance protein B
MTRRDARIHAFILVFQLSFRQDFDRSVIEAYLEGIENTEKTEDGEAFIIQEVLGTIEKLAEIDPLIGSHLKDWDLDRISKVDLALLRLATYEIRYSAEVSPATAINEAVDIAKIYGTDDSPSFINGLLGRLHEGDKNE